MRVLFRKTVVGDWCFDYLSSSESSEESSSDYAIYDSGRGLDWSVLPWCDWLSKCESCSDWSVVVLLLFLSIFCLLRYVGFIWGHVWDICKVQVAVDIGSEVLVLSLCTSFLMSVIVVSLCCKWHIQQSPSPSPSPSRFCV